MLSSGFGVFWKKERKHMYKSFTMELAGKNLTVDVGRVAKQANGAAFMHYGETTVLSTATASEKPREGIDFFPLSVEYEEKMYAVGKIPGGFNKREGKASENAVLTSRVIDRPMRPLFPCSRAATARCAAMRLRPTTQRSAAIAIRSPRRLTRSSSSFAFLRTRAGTPPHSTPRSTRPKCR